MQPILSSEAEQLQKKLMGLQDYDFLKSHLPYTFSISAVSKSVIVKTNTLWIKESFTDRFYFDTRAQGEELVILRMPEEVNMHIVRTKYKLTLINLATDYKFFFGCLDLQRFTSIAGSLSDPQSEGRNRSFITYLDNHLVNLLLKQKGEQFILHANALLCNDSIVLLIGKSGSGKTTTSLRLLQFGLTLFSDDLLFVDAKECKFYRGPKKPKTKGTIASDARPSNIESLHVSFSKSTLIFLEHDPTFRERTIEQIDSMRSLQFLLDATYQPSTTVTSRLFEFCCRFAASSRSYLFQYPDPQELEVDVLNILHKC